jgi:hypothetical protein
VVPGAGDAGSINPHRWEITNEIIAEITKPS